MHLNFCGHTMHLDCFDSHHQFLIRNMSDNQSYKGLSPPQGLDAVWGQCECGSLNEPAPLCLCLNCKRKGRRSPPSHSQPAPPFTSRSIQVFSIHPESN